MKAVMDTNVVLAGLRSQRGASFEILRRLRADEWTTVVSNHLLFEYEEVLKREAPALNLTLNDVDELLNFICARAEEHLLSPAWQPVLTDSDDEPLAISCRIGVHADNHAQRSTSAAGLGVRCRSLEPRRLFD